MIVYRSANWWFNGKRSASWCLVTGRLDPLDRHFTINFVRTLNLGWPWKSMQFQAISNTLKIIKLVSQDPPKYPKWGPNRYLKSSNSWKSQKMKYNENITIYYTFDRLGHQKSADFPFKNHEETCLQSKHVFCCFKWQNISKSDPKWSPTGDPKSITNHKNPPWDLPGSLWVHLWPTWLQNGAKMMSKDLPMEPKWSSEDPKRKWKSTKSNNNLCNPKFIFWIVLHWFQSWKSVSSC